MSTHEDIATLKNPENIRYAVLASSPYVLRKAFERDPTVQRLIQAGRRAAPAIAEALERGSGLPEISRACLVYILDKIAPQMVKATVAPFFRATIARPGPFFIHFAAHSLRKAHGLPVRHGELHYTEAELNELLGRLS